MASNDESMDASTSKDENNAEQTIVTDEKDQQQKIRAKLRDHFGEDVVKKFIGKRFKSVLIK